MTTLSDKFEEALALAHQLHRHQRRKGNDAPYVAHLLGVASSVLKAGGDEDEAIAGLLHDAVEDQGGSAVLAQIRERFGDRVAGIVEACSEWIDEDEKAPWRERKETSIRHVATASPSELLVIAADKLDNARSLRADYREAGEDLWDRFHGGRDGTLWYYRAMLEALLAAAAPAMLTTELTHVVEEIEREAGG